MNINEMIQSNVRGIYFEDGLTLSILKENRQFWMTRAQLSKLFDCDEKCIQLAMTRLRRQENFIFRNVMSTFPLVLQHTNAPTHNMCEYVRKIQHFNQAMVIELARYIPSVHIDRFLYWCTFLGENSVI